MDKGLTMLLKEMLFRFNKEARVVPPNLENEMCLALDRVGGEWLLAGLEAQGIDGATEIRQNPDRYWQVLREEAGQKRLQETIETNRTTIVELRRKTVNLLRLFKKESQGIEFKVDMLPDNGGIYKMLCHEQKGD